jgi:hypothetical protein
MIVSLLNSIRLLNMIYYPHSSNFPLNKNGRKALEVAGEIVNRIN